MTKEEIFEELKGVLANVKPKLDLKLATMDASLVGDLGIDSLSMLLISLAVENRFNIQFKTQETFQTVGEVVQYIFDSQS